MRKAVERLRLHVFATWLVNSRLNMTGNIKSGLMASCAKIASANPLTSRRRSLNNTSVNCRMSAYLPLRIRLTTSCANLSGFYSFNISMLEDRNGPLRLFALDCPVVVYRSSWSSWPRFHQWHRTVAVPPMKLTSCGCWTAIHQRTRSKSLPCPPVPAMLHGSRSWWYDKGWRAVCGRNRNPEGDLLRACREFVSCHDRHQGWFGGWISTRRMRTQALRSILTGRRSFRMQGPSMPLLFSRRNVASSSPR